MQLSHNLKESLVKVFHEPDEGFLSHGDMWITNVMFNHEQTSCKIMDWQTLSTKGPYIDFIKLVALGANPEDLEVRVGTKM